MTPSLQPAGAGPDGRRIVIVIGPGRSGTSTVAGSLAMSGLEVPGSAIKGNETNPSGFYEPRWVVNFHKELLDRSRVGTLDSSPEGLELVSTVTEDPKVRARLKDWLAERLEEQPRLVVKDPRSIWFGTLWLETARELGVEPGFVTMLRHPAEVSASRQKYYARGEKPDTRPDDIARIAGWINVALTAELVTRQSPRAFVRYTDLVADWRRELGRIGDVLDLSYSPGLDVTDHPVDSFIDPTLHRVQVDWDDTDIPASLRDLGERVWTSLSGLADLDDEAAAAVVAGLREEYRRMRDDAVAMSRPVIRRAELTARRRARRQLKNELAEQEAAAAEAAQAPTDAVPDGGGLLARARAARRRLTGGTA